MAPKVLWLTHPPHAKIGDERREYINSMEELMLDTMTKEPKFDTVVIRSLIHDWTHSKSYQADISAKDQARECTVPHVTVYYFNSEDQEKPAVHAHVYCEEGRNSETGALCILPKDPPEGQSNPQLYEQNDNILPKFYADTVAKAVVPRVSRAPNHKVSRAPNPKVSSS